MNVHIIPNEKFTQNFIEFINRNFDINDHFFYIYKEGTEFIHQSYKNVKYVNSLINSIDLLMVEDDKIFIHGFYSSKIIRFLTMRISQINVKRLVIIIWGADLYNGYFILNTKGLHLRTRINELLKKRFIRKASCFMTFAAPDFELLCKRFETSGKQFDCLYPSSIDVDTLDNLKKNKKENSRLRIMVGNSATITNQHIEMLEILTRFAGENIEIICPLSYGNKEYAEEIERFGKLKFGDKFNAIKEYLNPEKYSEFLNSVDVAVFNNNRQQATANIEILSYLGKKVYVRSDTTTWGHYVERDKCAIFDTLKIKSMEFNEFKRIEEDNIKINVSYFSRIWNEAYIKKLWEDVIKYEIN